jgi:hypothetical protein
VLKKFVTHCLTGKDNETFDIARVLWGVGVLSFVLYAGWAAFWSGAFDLRAYGEGFAFIMGAGGGSVWAKAKTEPEPKWKIKNDR